MKGELLVRLLSQRNFGDLFGQKFLQKVMIRMFSTAFKPPAYTASKLGGKSRHRALSKPQALPNMVISCSI